MSTTTRSGAYPSDFFRAAPAIWLRCKACRHVGQVEVAELAKRYTMNTPTRTLLALFKCAECGNNFGFFAHEMAPEVEAQGKAGELVCPDCDYKLGG